MTYTRLIGLICGKIIDRIVRALALLGGVILGVFAQVAMLPGATDLHGELVVQLIAQRVDFVLKLLLDIHRTETIITRRFVGGLRVLTGSRSQSRPARRSRP